MSTENLPFFRKIFPKNHLKICALPLLIFFIMAPTANAACPSSQPADYSGQTINGFNFGACLSGSLVGANFSNANLSGSTFANANLSNANFTSATLGSTESFPAVNFNGATLKKSVFSSATMAETNFEYANFHCTDFSNTTLMQANFGATQNIVEDGSCRTNFTGAELSVNLITDPANPGNRRNWGLVIFTDANFQDMNPAKVSFANMNISNAILTGTNFTGFDFTGASLENVAFNKAKLDNTKFDNAIINGINLDNSTLVSASFTCAQGYGSAGGTKKADNSACPPTTGTTSPTTAISMKNAKATGADFTGVDFSQAALSGATLTRGLFVNANLSQASLIAQGTETSPAQVSFTSFDNANLSQAKLSSVDFSGASLLNANLSNTTLNNTNFSTSTLDKADFSNAIMQGVNFSKASLKSSSFSNASISQSSQGGVATNFSCAQLGGADLSHATISAGVFDNAVLVDESYCCPPKNPQAPYLCGYIDSLSGIAYAQTTFPNVTGTAVKCPDSSIATPVGPGVAVENQCPSKWRLSSNWKTTGCSLSGEKTMWGINCSAKPGDHVVFADENLKACILSGIAGSPTEVLVSVAEKIQTVNCPARDIASIGGLEYFTQMHTLDLSDNNLAAASFKFHDVDANHTALITLNLENNSLTSLDLTNVATVELLNVSDNKLSGISLNANTYLVSLYAGNNKLISFDLAMQSNIVYADLSNNLLTGVLGQYSSNLNALTKLVFLDISNNNINTIGSIKSIAADDTQGNLNNLYLECNPSFVCADLKVYDGTKYQAAETSGCSVYDAPDSQWVPQTNPICNQ